MIYTLYLAMNKVVEKRIDNIRIKCEEIVANSHRGVIGSNYAVSSALEMIAELFRICIEQSKQIDNLESLFKDYVDIKNIRSDKIDKLINGE